jgi:hypothetical protein
MTGDLKAIATGLRQANDQLSANDTDGGKYPRDFDHFAPVTCGCFGLARGCQQVDLSPSSTFALHFVVA